MKQEMDPSIEIELCSAMLVDKGKQGNFLSMSVLRGLFECRCKKCHVDLQKDLK